MSEEENRNVDELLPLAIIFAMMAKILETSGDFEIEYFEIKSNDLVSQPNSGNARVFVAVNIEDVRLIDNLEIAK
jgi:pantothenate synthetase